MQCCLEKPLITSHLSSRLNSIDTFNQTRACVYFLSLFAHFGLCFHCPFFVLKLIYFYSGKKLRSGIVNFSVLCFGLFFFFLVLLHCLFGGPKHLFALVQLANAFCENLFSSHLKTFECRLSWFQLIGFFFWTTTPVANSVIISVNDANQNTF